MTTNKLKQYYKKNQIEAGCDEAGRGCLAGPVFAAAVILPPRYKNPLLTDSKLVAEKTRYILREEIEKKAVAWAVASVDNEKIDEINILKASWLAMHLAIEKLSLIPQFLLIDGNCFAPYSTISHQCIVRGDSTYLSIAAASILAKTYRDDYMKSLHLKYEAYGWNQNKGYATRFHRDKILELGFTPFHRKSFHLKEMQLSFQFDDL